MRARLVALATVVGLLAASSAFAAHHLWDFTEIYSNADGSVQYMELYTAVNSEHLVGAWYITQGGNTFDFVTDLPSSSTADTYILLATAGFAALPGGVTPDYVIPSNFFSTGGGTLNYADVDFWNYGPVPTDGVNALQRNGSTAPNSPTNFAGASGSVDLSVSVPALPTWGIVLLVGAMLLAASGLLRRRGGAAAA